VHSISRVGWGLGEQLRVGAFFRCVQLVMNYTVYKVVWVPLMSLKRHPLLGTKYQYGRQPEPAPQRELALTLSS